MINMIKNMFNWLVTRQTPELIKEDLENFEVSKVTNFSEMFKNCELSEEAKKQKIFDDIFKSKDINITEVFKNCKKSNE